MKTYLSILGASILLLAGGCNSVYNLKMNPEKTDFAQNQTMRLESRHFRIPCRIVVQCPETMIGIRDSLFFTDTYRYPLEMILDYTFKSIGDYLIQETVPSGNEFLDRNKTFGEVKAEFSMNITENGKEIVESAGKKSVQYYEVTFNVLPDGSVQMEE